MIQEGKRIGQAFILDRHTMPAYFETDHIRGISIFCAESLKLLFGELRKGYFSFCSACILHLEIAALLPQRLPAEAVKLMAYGFHLGNREHLSSSPPLSGREAGFFFSLSIPMAKGGFGHFSSNSLKKSKKNFPGKQKLTGEIFSLCTQNFETIAYFKAFPVCL